MSCSQLGLVPFPDNNGPVWGWERDRTNTVGNAHAYERKTNIISKFPATGDGTASWTYWGRSEIIGYAKDAVLGRLRRLADDWHGKLRNVPESV